MDNLSHVKSLFDYQEVEGFFSYQQLNQYDIKNKTEGSSAGVYVFRFASDNDAAKWFNTVDSSHPSHRLIVFGKPKKLMVLAGQEVILIEGYRMSNFKELDF